VGVVTLVIVLGLLVTFLTGVMVGAWASLSWMWRLRPGRESDLIAELAALRASTAGQHLVTGAGPAGGATKRRPWTPSLPFVLAQAA
jgi:hypothetical protein